MFVGILATVQRDYTTRANVISSRAISSVPVPLNNRRLLSPRPHTELNNRYRADRERRRGDTIKNMFYNVEQGAEHRCLFPEHNEWWLGAGGGDGLGLLSSSSLVKRTGLKGVLHKDTKDPFQSASAAGTMTFP